MVSFAGIGIFRKYHAKGYRQCETAQTHLVLAQVSDIQRGKDAVPTVGQQVQKSIALALRETHQQKNQAVVISGSVMSSQGEEIMETAEFAELLRDMLLAEAMNGETDTFNCIVIAVQSAQQQQVFNQYFQKWLDKNVVSGEDNDAEHPGDENNEQWRQWHRRKACCHRQHKRWTESEQHVAGQVA